MNDKILKYIKQKVADLPTYPGVYKMYDLSGTIIYIGKAKNLKNRVSSYFLKNVKHEKVRQMVEMVNDFDYIITSSELEALNLESNLIKQNQPFYNILLKDDKAFPYIKINLKERWPRCQIVRRILKDKALYFGPYFGGVNANDLMKIINSTFKIKDCNFNTIQKRACLNYHIGLCSAPCINVIDDDEYKKEVYKVIDFLKGNTKSAKQILTDKMNNCAKLQMFERAIEYKDALKLVDKINSRLVTDLIKNIDIDVFAYYTNETASIMTVLIVRAGKMIGLNNYNLVLASSDQNDIVSTFVSQYYSQNKIIPENIFLQQQNDVLSSWINEQTDYKVNVIAPKIGANKKLVDLAELNGKQDLEKSLTKDKLTELKTIGAITNLQNILNLSKKPFRIEGYDISNISGTNTVASMVVFTNGVSNKAHYRKFKLATDYPNDFLSMKEVITRRVNEYKKGSDVSFSNKPDLILIDGGKGQLGYAKNVLDELDFSCDIISLAKQNEEVFKPGISQSFIMSKDNFSLKLLQNVRDESHRFAITFHRSLRGKNTLKSLLEDIDGIGKKTVQVLYKNFKSIENIKAASIQDLNNISGVNITQAKNIYNFFNGSK